MGISRSSLYGESIFTSFRSIDGKVPFLDLHLKRLFEGVNDYYFSRRLTQENFYNFYLPKGLNLDKKSNEYFRMTFESETSPLTSAGIGLAQGNLRVEKRELPKIAPSISLKSSPSPFTRAAWQTKSGSYFESFLAKKHAIQNGFEEALFYDERKFITEATTSRIVFVHQDEFYTPRLTQYFESTGVKIFEKFLADSGKKLKREDIQLGRLKNFESAYLVNSVRLLTPIDRIDSFNLKIDEKLRKSFYDKLGCL